MTDRYGPGSDSPPPARKTAVADIRTSVFQSNIPTYILDHRFWFEDWNSAFEMIFGDIPGVRRQEHVSVWAQSLANYEAVRAHAEVFSGIPPSVDTEPIEFQSDRFGKFVFKKIATSAIGGDAVETVGWVIVLNIDSVEKVDDYYAELSDRMAAQLAWTKYAVCYDSVLQEFTPYRQLATAHIEAVASSGKRILDLGAGTGYLTRQLLARNKLVRAIDYNDAMLQRLRRACDGFPGLTVTKADLDTLQGLPENEHDGVVMMNALSWLSAPLTCLRKAWATLRRGGLIALSCPAATSTLDALFRAIEAELVKRNRLSLLRRELDQVRERNEEMERRGWLRKFSLDQVTQLLTNAGFTEIVQAEAGVYAGQGLFVVARK